MTTDKLTPTHSFSQWGQAAAPSVRDKPRCQEAGAPTRVTLPSLTLVFLTSYPEETGTAGDPSPRPPSTQGRSFRTGKSSRGLSTGVLSSANVTLAFYIKHGSHDHLTFFFSLHVPESHAA